MTQKAPEKALFSRGVPPSTRLEIRSEIACVVKIESGDYGAFEATLPIGAKLALTVGTQAPVVTIGGADIEVGDADNIVWLHKDD